MQISLKYIIIVFLFLCFCYSASKAEVNHGGHPKWETLKNQILTLQDKKSDSVRHYLKIANSFVDQHILSDKEHIFLQNTWGNYFAERQQSDSAIHFFKKSLKTLRQSGDQHLIHNQMLRLADVYNDSYMSDSALRYYHRALSFFQNENDSANIAISLSGIATALIESGHNKEALEKLFEAEPIFKARRKYRELGVVYDNIAMINAELGYETKTIIYGKKAIAFYEKVNDSIMVADAYANLGVSYKNLGLYDSALHFYRKSNDMASQLKSNFLLAKNLHNIAVVYDELGNTEKATTSFRSSLEICKLEHIPFGIFNNSINLGELLLNRGDMQQAIFYFMNAAKIGKEQNYDQLGLVFDLIHNAYARAGNHEQALNYLRKYMHFNDSTQKAQKHSEIMELQTRYETKKKEAQILKLQQEKQKEKLLRAYLLIGFVLVLVVAMLLILFSWQKNAKIRHDALILEKENQRKLDQMEKLQLEKKLQKQAAEKFCLDLKMKEQQLVYHTLKEAGLNHLIKRIKEKLHPYTYRFTRKCDRERFNKSLQEIAIDSSQDPLADFEEIFLQMHSGFYEKLLDINTDFTRSELQMAALLRMNLPSKEIARMLNLAISTIDKRRHCIRQKIGLTSEQSLTGYLIGI